MVPTFIYNIIIFVKFRTLLPGYLCSVCTDFLLELLILPTLRSSPDRAQREYMQHTPNVYRRHKPILYYLFLN